MKQLFLSILLLSSIALAGQTQQAQKVDSLINVLNTQKLSAEDEAMVCAKICNSCFYVDPSLIDEYSKRGLKLAKKAGNKKIQSLIHESIGQLLGFEGKYDLALEEFTTALNLAKEIKDEVREACIYISFGVVTRNQSKYNEALDYYTKALAIYEKIDDKVNITTILTNIGSIHRSLYDVDRAMDYVLRAKELAEETNNLLNMMATYDELSSLYMLQKNPEKADEYTQKVLELCRVTGNKPREVVALQSMSYRALNADDYDKALEYAERCLQIAQEIKNQGLIIGAGMGLAQVYTVMERYEEGQKTAIEAWELDPEDLHHAPTLLYIALFCSIALNDTEKASELTIEFHDLYKKTNNSGLHQALLDTEVKYETEKKEMQIASLEKQKQLYIWLGIAAGLLALALILVFWLRMRSAQKEKQLVATRSVLDGEMGERARLSRDLHDRLGGNLSAVKIGLSDQRESLENVCRKLDSCIDEVRRVAHNLMPVSLQYGLKAALEDYSAQFDNVYFHFFGEEHRIEERKEYIIYCCASELITNSLRHSGTENINVQLVQSKSHISLTVQDDGCGFDEKTNTQGFGLKSIRDRILSYNGKIDVVSSPGKGTETTIELRTDKA